MIAHDITQSALYKVLDVLDDNQRTPLSATTIANLSGLSYPTVRKILGNLKKVNRVKITKTPLSKYVRK